MRQKYTSNMGIELLPLEGGVDTCSQTTVRVITVCGGAAMTMKMPDSCGGNAWANPSTAAEGEMIAASSMNWFGYF